MRQLKITSSITNRADKSLEKYLQDISKEEMITADEETRLTILIREGDTRALDKMVKANLRFVVSVAKQYQHQGLPLTDLINEGNLGLIKAAKKFDETRGFKFISYAVWWIRQAILEALSDKARVIRIPLNQVGVLGKINKAYSKLEQDLGRAPSEEEIAHELDIPEHKVKETLKTSKNHVSYDAPVGGDDENSTMIELLSNGEALSTDYLTIDESLKVDIERSLGVLDPKCREIIKLNYGIGYSHPKSLDEIGEKYSLTRERVRQIKEKGLRKLRVESRSKILKQYL
jgi:RNA polymerase primary sigma factor